MQVPMGCCLKWKWVVLWSLWAARLVRQPTLPVRVTGGLLRGDVAHDGSHVHYLNIPYATVEHRFQGPGPEPKWEGIFDAVNENVRCSQRLINELAIGQEDCLILNVYTPLNTNPDAGLPVMFFIHGGGYFGGSGSKIIYGPEYLVDKEVILVTINYRLNIQGFLCLGIKEAPGNAGMKDQVAALKWVQRNIRVFGGDPDNVTIFGESAGGSSVSYHMLSPMSKGLFHKAITQSGSSLTAWANQFRPIYMASLLTKSMGHDTQDPYEIYNILINKTRDELVITNIPRKEGNFRVSEVLYAPCVEKVIEGVEPFMTDVPYNVLSKGEYNKVPVIMGVNSEEGFLCAVVENDTMIEQLRFEKSLPKDLLIPENERKEIADTLQKMYMGDDDNTFENKVNMSRFPGELYFQYPTLEETELKLQANDKPIYSYLFNYYGWRNLPKLFMGRPFVNTPGATHADELFYLFHQTLAPLSLFENKMIDRMTTLWTNFAKYGNPTPEVTDVVPMRWEPTQLSDPQSLVLDEELRMAPLWFSDTLLYWRKLYSKYRRKKD